MASMMLTGCCATIHEYPDDEPEDLTEANITIVVNIDRAAPLGYKQITINDDGTTTTELLAEEEMSVQDIGDHYDMNLIVKVYRGTVDDAANAEVIDVETFTISTDDRSPQRSFTISLPKGNYFCKAWADYITDDGTETTYYDESSLSSVYSDYENYPDDTRYRSAVAATEAFRIESGDTDRQIEFTLTRPVGRYRVVATDYELYMIKAMSRGDDDEIYARVRYKMYVGIAYSVHENRQVDYVSSYRFTAQANWADQLDEIGERSLIGDYLFGEPDREVNVLADVTFIDSSGKTISTYTDLKIPIRPNHETVIKGNFLTKSFNNDGGVKIDEGFDNEVVVYI